MSIKINEVDKVEDVEIENEELEGKEIEIRQYLPILEKLSFIKNVYENTVETDNNTHIINSVLFDIVYKTSLIKVYSNVDISENMEEAYDEITSTGLYNHVYNAIPESEISELERVVGNFLNDKEKLYIQTNSVSTIIKQALESIMELIPSTGDMTDLLANAESTVNGFNKDKLEFIGKSLEVMGARGEVDGNNKDIQPTGIKTKGNKK